MFAKRVAEILTLSVLYFVISPTSFVDAQEINIEADPRYAALTWMQNSAEYSLLVEQTYRAALVQLQAACQDCNWSADEIQMAEGNFGHKKPAVILDVDETVLDNSAYNARNILQGKQYSTENWNAWCQEAKADAIPGALQFVNAAQEMGVKVFYVTNRRDVVKDATIKNLSELGFPVDESMLLTKNPEQGRGDDKVSRRAMIAKDYRILLLIGDSMSDLCSGMDEKNTVRRNEIASKKGELLGTRWIIMPNPVYGSWQRALPAGEGALKAKID